MAIIIGVIAVIAIAAFGLMIGTIFLGAFAVAALSAVAFYIGGVISVFAFGDRFAFPVGGVAAIVLLWIGIARWRR